jgi:hypothetical protein
LERISAATGQPPSAWATLEDVDENVRAALEERNPLEAKALVHGIRIGLRFYPDGERERCHFWTEERGCTLAIDVRPRFCASYPLYPTPTGSLALVADRQRCRAVADTQQKTCERMGINPLGLTHLAWAHSQELRLHASLPPIAIGRAYGRRVS